MRDPAFAALILAMPGETEIAQEIGANVDPDAIHRAREALRERLGRALGRPPASASRRDSTRASAYSPDAASAGRRSLRNVALDLLAAADRSAGEALAGEQFAAAANMTDRIAALADLDA